MNLRNKSHKNAILAGNEIQMFMLRYSKFIDTKVLSLFQIITLLSLDSYQIELLIQDRTVELPIPLFSNLNLKTSVKIRIMARHSTRKKSGFNSKLNSL